MWNEKDYSHEGLGKIMKELNGDHLTKITQPPDAMSCFWAGEPSSNSAMRRIQAHVNTRARAHESALTIAGVDVD
jgi:hypothetical protein